MQRVFIVTTVCLLCLSVAPLASAQNKGQNQETAVIGTVSEDWFSNAQEQVRQDEYMPSIQPSNSRGEQFAEPRLHFANRAQNLRVYFDGDGIELMPRVVQGGQSWNMELHFPSVYGSEPEIIGNTVVYQHESVIQQFTNSPAGIEQNMTVLKKPNMHGSLTLDAKIEMQGLQLSHHAEGCLMFSHEDGEVTYRILKVADAQNRALKSSISYNGFGNLSVSISDNNAVYPVHMRIRISSDTEQIERAVYSDNNILGTRQTPDPDWTAESDQPGACFGYSVSTAGDVNGDGYVDVIIGAPYFDNGQTNEGRAYVFHNSVSGLSTIPDWTAESDQDSAFFGASVSTAGDVNGDGYADVIVSACSTDNGQTDEGRAYVYHGSASGLSPTPDWTAESDQQGAEFGLSVSTAGDVNGDGYADIIVGAPRLSNGHVDEGRAYVYHGSASGLSTVPDWIAEPDWWNAEFGYSVSTAGDVNGDGYADVIVAAPWLGNGNNNEGRAYVYHGSVSGLSQTPDWTAEPDQQHAFFGYSLSTAGDVNGDGYADVIIGSFLERVYVYHGSASGLSQSVDWTAESDQYNARFGLSVSTAGDMNGDGYADVIVGAYAYEGHYEGRAFVYRGSALGLSTTPAWIAHPDQEWTWFGYSVATPGDVNNDGNADVIIGAPAYDNGQAGEGRAFVYYARARHNISTDSMVEPLEYRYEEYSQITPSAVFRNAGFYDENNIPVTFLINLGANTVYTSNRMIDFLASSTDTLIIFDDFTVGVCGSHYQALVYSSLPEDTIFSDDTLTRNFVTGRYYELPAPGCNAWKFPNADSGFVPYPTNSNWILATQPEMQQISALDSSWWVTAGALDTAHQDLQLYGFQFDGADTLIEELTVDWWGHHGDTTNSIQQHCALYLWNNQAGTWAQTVYGWWYVFEDAHFSYEVPHDSISAYVSSWGYMYVCAGADYQIKSCCPLLFAFNGTENVFIGDVITGCDIGMWLDRVLGSDIYLPPDYDEYVRIDGEHLENLGGRYRLTVNEMLQEVSYLDEVKLYVIDHPVEYDVYPHEALVYPGYQGLDIHTSNHTSLKAAIDEHGRDVLSMLDTEDRVYVPFERSGITGFAQPFAITFDVGDLADPSSAVLYLYGSTRFQDSDEIEPVSDIYQAGKQGMKLQNPRVEVIDASGKWKKVASCGMPRGHKKTVTYQLYDETGTSIFATGDHRLRITFYTEVYLDKAWVSCHTTDDYRVVELEPDVANLHYYGYAQYHSPDGKYPGDYSYDKKVTRDYANVVGHYTKYGDVRPLLDEADSKFAIMCHGDEIALEFDAEELPDLPEGWKRDFIFASKGFYKMARPGRAYAYSVDPLPFYGMRDDMSANGVGYYPYDPSPGLVASLIGRIYARIVWDYPFSWSDAIAMIKLHLLGKVKSTYPAELTEYCQEWNTRQVGAYFPDYYADAPPHFNREQVPLHEHDGTWTTHLASLGIPFGDHSLHSNYVRVWLVTTVPLAVEEQGLDVVTPFALSVGYPNPFRSSTRINYAIPSQSKVKLNIYDISGRLVRSLVDGVQQSGSYSMVWNGIDDRQRKCAAGAYFIKLTAGEFNETGKVLLIR